MIIDVSPLCPQFEKPPPDDGDFFFRPPPADTSWLRALLAVLEKRERVLSDRDQY